MPSVTRLSVPSGGRPGPLLVRHYTTNDPPHAFAVGVLLPVCATTLPAARLAHLLRLGCDWTLVRPVLGGCLPVRVLTFTI